MTAPERDRSRRYLVTVGPYPLPDEPQDTHLALIAWQPRLEAWLHGQAICGRTVLQGEQATGTAVTCEDCENLRPDYERILGGDPPDLTAAEARAEVDRLNTELYRAQDALAFVGEMCDRADRQGRAITTAQVRRWLTGPQCARQAGLVLPGPAEDGGDSGA